MESPTTVEKPHVAVIGAGMSGLVCASELSARSVPVRVFEKSRGPGGRMSTRRSPSLGRDADFDHGAQYFTVRAPELMGRVEQWMSAGVVAPWHGRIVSIAADGVETSNTRTQRFVGVPSMSAICRHLARGLDVHFDTPVARIEGGARDWRLIDCNGRSLGEFDLVISTAPAPQTAALLERAAPDLADRISHVRMQPCWALLAAFGEPLPVGFDGAFINEGPLSWVARTSSKPGRRSTPERWVLHANPGWSERHLEASASHVIASLLDAFCVTTRSEMPATLWAKAHRWRYALCDAPLDDGCLYDGANRIGACGDWANGNRIEGAFLSGSQMARTVCEAYGPALAEG